MKWKTTDSPAYLKQAPSGVPGDVTRVDESNVEPVMLVNNSGYPTVGMGVKYTTGGVEIPSGDSATAFAGVVIREAPAISNSSSDDTSFSPNTPLVTQVQGLLVRGYVSVVCAAGTPARGGVVYWQVTTHSGVNAGQFRADGTDSGNAVALTATQAEWATDGVGPDGSGNTNIAELRVAR
jgi:hypothetical protein